MNHYKQTSITVPGTRVSRVHRSSQPENQVLRENREASMEQKNPPELSADIETVRAAAAVLIPRSPALLSLDNGMAKRVILPVIFDLIQFKCDARVKRAIERIKEHYRQIDLIAEAVRKDKRRKAKSSNKPDKPPADNSKQTDESEIVDKIVASHFTAPVWQKPGMQEIARKMTVYKMRQIAAAEGSDNEVLANGLTFKQMQSRARFSGTVYNGEVIRQEGIPVPMYVDLATIKAIESKDGTQPALMNHDSQKAVGHHRPQVASDRLTVSDGRFSVLNPSSREVMAAAAGGYTWQASIRGRFDGVTMIKADQTARVNGRTVEGPGLIAHNFRWRETSFTALGANAPSEDGTNAEFEIQIVG